MTSNTTSHYVWVEHPEGRLFARHWTPIDESAVPRTRAPLLLFHDSLGSVGLWRNFPEALCEATGRQVIAYDRLGFGRSSARTDRLNLDFIADEAASVLPVLRAQLGLETFIAFGHSVGGAMAVECAAQWSDACVGLITEAAQVFPEDRTLDGIRVAQQQFAQPGQVERLAKYHGDKTQWVLNAWIGTWLDPAFAGWSLVPNLPQVVCPALIMHGAHDEYGSLRHPELIRSLAGGPTRIEIFENGHHVPHREDSERIIFLVTEFVMSLP
ncbi:alpha/beta fold hydrolase [Deinococcus humi]|uniref:Pimeloyl-ACP methyl ester carboxylesterase n=1 Tax=Deinococcus humi TaxID=662880 RepID=A0A7W8JY69_9DEIO|nr:alpha/beta fold hydrolase [Deinococcus humi]MBB5365391.1 pimeloyl-ACP methyl ester carboxylesterase [Deinococcus humi]